MALRRTLLVGLSALSLGAALPLTPPSAATPRTPNSEVITDWNRTADAVINGDAKL